VETLRLLALCVESFHMGNFLEQDACRESSRRLSMVTTGSHGSLHMEKRLEGF
jgi:hypothetical protein